MKTAFYCIAIIASFLALSCQKEKHPALPLKTVVTTEPDSVAEEKYSRWQETKEYNSFNSKQRDTLVLDKLETERDTVLINDFLTAHDTLKISDYSRKKMASFLHSIDINGDGNKDLIYEGASGGEGFVTHIFLNKGVSFEKIFTEYQYFTNPEFKDCKLVSFMMLKPGCCADPQIMEHYYTVTYNKNIPTFSPHKTVGYVNYVQKVKEKFTTEQSFTVVNNIVSLYAECYILNIEHPIYGPAGNIMAKFSKGTTGKAIGKSHENGKDWLYVMMTPKKTQVKFSQFEKEPDYIYGWMLKSETDLK